MTSGTLIASTPLAGLRAAGPQGQRPADTYLRVSAIVRERLGRTYASLFARPQLRADGSAIDWYTDLPGDVTPASRLPEGAQRSLRAVADERAARVRDLASSIRASSGSGRAAADVLARAVLTPGGASLYAIGGEPVLVLWGYESAAAAPAVSPAAAAGAAAAALAPPALGAGSAGWLRWMLLLLLLGLLAYLVLLALRPLAPNVVEQVLPGEDLGPELAAARERGQALRALLASLGDERDALECVAEAPAEAEAPAVPAPVPVPAPDPAVALNTVTPPEPPPPEPGPPPETVLEPPPKLGPMPEIVVPPPPVASAPAASRAAPSNCPSSRKPFEAPEVMLVVDASGSMRDGIPGASSRMEASKRSIAQVVPAVPGDVDIGLIEFTDCSRITADRFYEPGERGRLLGRVNGLRPERKTPLAASVRRAGDRLSARVDGYIVVVTDGEDSCGGDPCAAARRVASTKPRVTINVIDISGGRNPTAACMARATGGRVFTPGSASEMRMMMQRATGQPQAGQCG